ncbi:protein ALTERED PHOSPHATE STARVATION RESPONSE 1-like [Coffea arabica]|uniref:Protein ALTERED PHOSPHATE STARVATION RESPONSE 1-like n=1 Tax=Coffea arabica TaxID=13443 RepID=A0A6P6T6W4_COFAR|nr:nitrate regulatory gene2 protein-like [Coffea arabica]XP_027077361.1 nitrate regulatory gene2 protein-like [Coffea arabica]
MGCCYSRIKQEEMVSRCKARKRYMKQLVKARQAFSAAHSMYLRSLRNTGSALLQFATNETNLHCQNHHLPPPLQPPLRLPQLPATPPPPPVPMSPVSDRWTTSTTTTTHTTSSALLPPPPPPPPPPPAPASSTWDFWDPFMPSSSRSGTEEEWEETTVASEVAATTTVGAASVAAPPSVISGFSKDTAATSITSELAMVVSTKGKDLVEIIKELDEYFLKAANAGGPLSLLLEVPTCTFSDLRSSGRVYGSGRNLNPLLWTWNSSPKWNGGFGRCIEDSIGNVDVGGGVGVSTTATSHCSTVERLYAWEKKLYQEVKNAESLKLEHERKAAQLRKLEVKRADYVKTERAKKEVEKLESRMMVASQAIETTSAEIIKLRESELYPQLVDLVKGLMGMWRSMYECHQVQTHIVQQLKYVNAIPSTNPTSEIHRQSTLQLELEAQQWHISFCNLVKAQRDYIQSLTGWLRLSLFQLGNKPAVRTGLDSAIYSFCEEWQHTVNNAPDKVASEGVKSFLTVIRAVVVQQTEEQKQKKKSESAFKELEKKAIELRSLESKYGPYSMADNYSSTRSKDPVGEKRAKVENLRARAEDEKAKYEKSVSVTRAMTLNNLQMGLPHVFQSVTGFANVCTHAFESVYNQAKSTDEMQMQMHDVKRLLP